MQFYQGHQTNYTYSATGAKLKVVDKTAPEGVILPVTSLNTVLSNPTVSMTTTTDYVDNKIYENGTLKRILTPVGYWQDGTYYYFLKDHLGSNRVVINSSGGIAETSSYYPSGMRFGESAAKLNNSVQPYRHTGLEMQEMHGLNWIDNGARFRTVNDGGGLPSVDPLAEKHPEVSPYVYCMGNLVNRIDLNGMDWIRNNNGNVEWRPDATKDNVPKGYSYVGTQYMGITITKFETTKNEYSNGGKDTRLLIEIGYKDPNPKKKDGYNWIQTVSRDGKNQKVDYDSESKEGQDNFPYYQPEDENKDSRNKNGFDITFHDKPNEPNAQGSFNAELSLIGESNTYKNISMIPQVNIPVVTGKTFTTIFTLNYGFSGSNVMLRVLPIKVINPSIFQSRTINQIK